ncbi:hypothetical protein MK805_12810 [Shimazuella sp. AN120528]|uniref:hypothetical protein n=1 Tax=Shimazuella soli TaxID=1892854 RepID=UPI001F0D52B4|nr:hypothetical protein [Shimazuella soli]MCH5585822.1 hypothetical protein [Shimazuella soli]
MLNGIKLPEEYELISVFCALPTYDFDDPSIDSFYKENIYEFCTPYEKVKISFSPVANDFSFYTYDLETDEVIISLQLQDRVKSLQILKDTKEQAIIQLDCGYPLEHEREYQVHKIAIYIKPRVKMRQVYYISYV